MRWTNEEKEYLQESWGRVAIPTIAATVGRTVEAVKRQAGRMKLGRHLDGGTEITFNALLKALCLTGSYCERRRRWERNGFPMRQRRIIRKSYRVVRIEEFWSWAEKHKSLVNFARLEPYLLGPEPEWLKEKRNADLQASRYKSSAWTLAEHSLLVALLRQYRYGYPELSQLLGRKERNIKRHIESLKIKERPVHSAKSVAAVIHAAK